MKEIDPGFMSEDENNKIYSKFWECPKYGKIFNNQIQIQFFQ